MLVVAPSTRELAAPHDRARPVWTYVLNGVQNVEIRAVWLNRDGQNRPVSIEPDWEITSMAELDNTPAGL